jgi:hypothetical protein
MLHFEFEEKRFTTTPAEERCGAYGHDGREMKEKALFPRFLQP